MKINHSNKCGRLVGSTLAALVLLAGSAVQAQKAHIINRPLTPDDVVNYKFPADIQLSGGLLTVGVGSAVYLEALVVKGTPVAGINWAITVRPSGSAIDLAPSPLGSNVPSFEPRDRLDYDIAGRQLLVPDKKGSYTITASVNTNGTSDMVLSCVVIAATYAGVGVVDGNNIAVNRQCGNCHDGGITPDKVTPWAKTGHGHFFTQAIDGQMSSHYSSNCISCHTLGYDTSLTATNGGFDDIAKQLGWTFPTVLTNGNWWNLPVAIKQVSNIQCENCHGPGSEHGGRTSNISVSFSAGVCASCHSEEPYHFKPEEWLNSKHAIAVREEEPSCAGCHSGIGFIDRMDGATTIRTNYAAVTCVTCHDPHSAEASHQLRGLGKVTLKDTSKPGGPTVITAAGKGAICMQCHMSRRDAATYVNTATANNRFGPHHGPQADMLMGVNAITYGKTIPSSAHTTLIGDTCVTCHMQSVEHTNSVYSHAGGHTFWISAANGTNAPTELVGVCQTCHGPGLTTFDLARVDYDGNGVVEGLQTEVKGLMNQLSQLLPPVGVPKLTVAEVSSSINTNYTAAQRKAVYNLLFVMEDKSYGIHNPSYAVGLLKASMADLKPGSSGGNCNVNDVNAALANYFVNSTNVIANPVSLGQGTFQLGIADPVGWNFGVQASTDLVNWTNLPTAAKPVYQFVDPDGTNSQKRFYRLRFP